MLQNDGLSYDFWEAFIAWDLDLKALKKLALNSIRYSGMTKQEKEKAYKIWQNRWNKFIKDLNESATSE
jgi:adenosine deaminase CECR1